MGKKKNNRTTRRAWSAEDRQNFADRNILRAQTVASRRFDGPEAEEWDDPDDDLWEDADDLWDIHDLLEDDLG